ncbi:MAG: fluoride efflux transporter CrcB [Saccharofermentanales bacterium]
MDVFLVAIGGAFGSLTRFQLGKVVSNKSGSSYPVGTFFINISGAFLLGVLSGMNPIDKNFYLLAADGFLGAYTTFSTFMYEGFSMFNDKKKNAAVYITTTFLLGLIGFFTGYSLSRLLISADF